MERRVKEQKYSEELQRLVEEHSNHPKHCLKEHEVGRQPQYHHDNQQGPQQEIQ